MLVGNAVYLTDLDNLPSLLNNDICLSLEKVD